MSSAVSSRIEDLTSSERWFTASNAVRWGLVVAARCGVAPSIVLPLQAIAAVGGEINAYRLAPDNSSLCKKILSYSVLPRLVTRWIPFAKHISSAAALYSTVRNSVPKLCQTIRTFRQHPVQSVKNGAVHLFNVASSVLFAADSAGLIDLDGAQKTPERETDAHSFTFSASATLPTCPNRYIVIGTVYEKGNPTLDRIADLVNQNHAAYAKKWHLEHRVASASNGLLAEQCLDPRDDSHRNCSVYWLKVPVMREWLRTQRAEKGREEWLLLLDYDMPITNQGINPYEAIDQLREGGDTSVVVTRDSYNWLDDKFPEDRGHNDPRLALNGGFWMIRKDREAAQVIENLWETRNAIQDLSNVDCPTLGLCKNQNSFHEQQGMVIVLKENPTLLDRVVSIIFQRDESSTTRASISVNTFNRDGCFKNVGDIYYYHLPADLDGKWRAGDWMGQPTGIPLYGLELASADGRCVPGADLKPGPHIYTFLREERVRQMLHSSRPTYRRITLGVAYQRGNPLVDDIVSIVRVSHAYYARKWNLEHYVVDTDHGLLTKQCVNLTGAQGEYEDCAHTWLKVRAMQKWLERPSVSDKQEEWLLMLSYGMPITNQEINPYDAIDQLREGGDTSVVVTRDSYNWLDDRFPNDRGHNDPRLALNGGFWMIRKDREAGGVLEALWKTRNTIQDLSDPDCPTIGLCQIPGDLNEQQGMVLVLKENPTLLDRVVSIVFQRDQGSKTRSHIAVNTFYRDGCFQYAGSSDYYDCFADSESGKWRAGDWMGQPTTAVPLYGLELVSTNGQCEPGADLRRGAEEYPFLRANRIISMHYSSEERNRIEALFKELSLIHRKLWTHYFDTNIALQYITRNLVYIRTRYDDPQSIVQHLRASYSGNRTQLLNELNSIHQILETRFYPRGNLSMQKSVVDSILED